MSFLTKALSLSNPYTAAAAIGGDAVAGILGNRKSARTQESTFSNTGSTSSVSRSKRVLRPEQEDAVGSLSAIGQRLLADPAGSLEPIRSARRTAVNSDFAGVDDALASRFLSFGQGRSGKFGRAARTAEVARRGALADVDSDMSRLALDERDRGLALLERLLGMNFEEEGGSSATTTQSGSGTNVLPGSMTAGGVAGGLSSLSMLTLLNKLLKGGGGTGLPADHIYGGG